MAMKKDDDKSKKTLSGKKPATFGGANSKLMASKPKASASSGPRAEPSRPMGRDASGSANFDRTPTTRATVSVGPATLSMGGKTAKSKGGMDMTGGKVLPNKSVNPMAKSGPGKVISPTTKYTGYKKTNSIPIAVGAGLATVGGGLVLAGGGKKIKQAAKYIADTKNRRARNKAQKAENEAMIVERESKKPKVATMKASKSTMKKLKAK